jgi:hypothetical protein
VHETIVRNRPGLSHSGVATGVSRSRSACLCCFGMDASPWTWRRAHTLMVVGVLGGHALLDVPKQLPALIPVKSSFSHGHAVHPHTCETHRLGHVGGRVGEDRLAAIVAIRALQYDTRARHATRQLRQPQHISLPPTRSPQQRPACVPVLEPVRGLTVSACALALDTALLLGALGATAAATSRMGHAPHYALRGYGRSVQRHSRMRARWSSS